MCSSLTHNQDNYFPIRSAILQRLPKNSTLYHVQYGKNNIEQWLQQSENHRNHKYIYICTTYIEYGRKSLFHMINLLKIFKFSINLKQYQNTRQSTYSRLLLPILVNVPQSHFNRVHVQNIHVITTSDPHLLYILLPINKLPVQVNTHGTVLDKHLKFSFKTFWKKRK